MLISLGTTPTVGDKKMDSSKESADQQALRSILSHISTDRYATEHVTDRSATFWAEGPGGYWHRMFLYATDLPHCQPPFLRVEFPVGQRGVVDLAALARGAGSQSAVGGVLITDGDVVLIAANRRLSTITPFEFDQVTSSINTQIVSFCMATGGDPPPGGGWSLERPSFPAPA